MLFAQWGTLEQIVAVSRHPYVGDAHFGAAPLFGVQRHFERTGGAQNARCSTGWGVFYSPCRPLRHFRLHLRHFVRASRRPHARCFTGWGPPTPLCLTRGGRYATFFANYATLSEQSALRTHDVSRGGGCFTPLGVRYATFVSSYATLSEHHAVHMRGSSRGGGLLRHFISPGATSFGNYATFSANYATLREQATVSTHDVSRGGAPLNLMPCPTTPLFRPNGHPEVYITKHSCRKQYATFPGVEFFVQWGCHVDSY